MWVLETYMRQGDRHLQSPVSFILSALSLLSQAEAYVMIVPQLHSFPYGDVSQR